MDQLYSTTRAHILSIDPIAPVISQTTNRRSNDISLSFIFTSPDAILIVRRRFDFNDVFTIQSLSEVLSYDRHRLSTSSIHSPWRPGRPHCPARTNRRGIGQLVAKGRSAPLLPVQCARTLRPPASRDLRWRSYCAQGGQYG